MSQAWLEAKLKDVNEEIAAGSVLTGGSTADVSTSRETQISAIERRKMILHDLHIEAPLQYTLEDVAPRRATVARFKDPISV